MAAAYFEDDVQLSKYLNVHAVVCAAGYLHCLKRMVWQKAEYIDISFVQTGDLYGVSECASGSVLLWRQGDPQGIRERQLR